MAETLQGIKQRFGIIGNSVELNRAIEKAMQVAPTEISVLVTGESGVGKEAMPKIIHALSLRKHNNYIAVNCGAIPEGTIDSELFGHEKGAFTGATQTRKGYFEMADNGTIFLDEVGELPLHTQVRLLRVLESGEFMKVGSSKIQKTNVRIVAATNVNVLDAVEKGKFREDLYYRLNTVEIQLPALRKRKDDISLLFRKFAGDFADKYQMPTLRLSEGAERILANYPWPGNVRQLRNFTEELSVLETQRDIDEAILQQHLKPNALLPANVQKESSQSSFANEREVLFGVLFDMKQELNSLKELTLELLNKNGETLPEKKQELIQKLFQQNQLSQATPTTTSLVDYTPNRIEKTTPVYEDPYFEEVKTEEDSLSLQVNEVDLIEKALEKHQGRRKDAAKELGISERTLYRKIKQYNL